MIVCRGIEQFNIPIKREEAFQTSVNSVFVQEDLDSGEDQKLLLGFHFFTLILDMFFEEVAGTKSLFAHCRK